MKQLITFLFECKFAIKLWSDLRHYCQSSFVIPILNPQSAIFRFFEAGPDLLILLNHILLLLQMLYLIIKRLFKAFIGSPIEKD